MIENLKDLERLLKLCRKQGITDITLNGVSVKFGELPEQRLATTQEEEIEEKYADFPDDVLSAEELTFFANGGRPEDNPYRREQ